MSEKFSKQAHKDLIEDLDQLEGQSVVTPQFRQSFIRFLKRRERNSWWSRWFGWLI